MQALDINQDLQEALARSPTGDEDTSTLEAELEELMKEDAHQPPNDNSGVGDDLEGKLQNLQINLPICPSESPDVSIQQAL